MKIYTVPGFRQTNREPRYYVRHLAIGPENPDGFTFEIQLLDRRGRAGVVVNFNEGEDSSLLKEYEVPEAVFQAAKRQPMNTGDYVNSEGESMKPF